MSVRALRRGSIAASRVTAPAGGTFTLYSDPVDGFVQSTNTDYATARAGANLNAYTTNTSIPAGQELFAGTRYIWESFLTFDTSAVTGTVQSATLSLHGHTDASTTDFTIQARLKDWGAALTTDDWVAGASLGDLPLLASRTSVGWSTIGHNQLTSEAAFAANINQAGPTRLLICSSRQTAGTGPTVDEAVYFYSGNAADVAFRPKLVVVTT